MRLLIIGAGPGGYETAVSAANRGIEVTIVTDGDLGGTCLNEGCIPTKTLCHYAELIEQNRKAGIEAQVDFARLMERKQAVIEQLRSGIEMLMGNKLITLVRGKAGFKDSHTVLVDGIEYKADKVIIATGSKSASLPIPGEGNANVLTSDRLLSIDSVPERLCVVGGGVIGLEMASVFRSLGSEVTVLEYFKDILPRFDTDLAKRLKQALQKRGVKIETGVEVKAIDGNRVLFNKKGEETAVEADVVLMAVGRRANVQSLNLDTIGVKYSGKGIEVDDRFRTSVPDVYAVGDVTGQMMLAHVATFQGRRALNDILGETDTIRFDLVPADVFTIPEVATVGLTEDECKEKGIDIKCLKSFFRANGKAVSMDETEGYCKIVVKADDGKLLGCHMMGAHSADVIQEMTALLYMGGTISDLRGVIHAHPTLGEVISAAANV